MSLLKIKYHNNKIKVSFLGVVIFSLVNDSTQNILTGIQNIWTSINSRFENLETKLEQFKYIYLGALKDHPNIFLKYKDIHREKDLVLLATGPSLNMYQPIKDAIHVGVNNAYRNSIIDLDFLFIQDETVFTSTAETEDNILNYRKGLCKKFFGKHYMDLGDINLIISQNQICKASAEHYWFLSHQIPTSNYSIMSPNISQRPLNTWGSVVFPALEFMLWTHPRRIYLVGCDCCDNGYFLSQNSPINTTTQGYKVMRYGWEKLKKFAEIHYPDIEIMSINPVGLKDLFPIYNQNK